MLGLGAEYQLSSGLAARVEAETFDKDMQLFSLGLLWRFGGEDNDAMMPMMDDHDASLDEPAAVVDEVIVEEPVIDVAPSIVVTPVIETPEGPKDTDGDGVSDPFDMCPASPAGMVANAEGCDSFSGTLEGVKFKPSSAQLTHEAERALDALAARLLDNPTVRVALKAHTDNSGSAVSNLELSKKRVISVVRYLMSRGVKGNRMRPEAFGESSPVVSNATIEGRQINRRMDIESIR